MTLPTKEELDAYDMTGIRDDFRPVPERDYLLRPAGSEHYRLLRWIGSNYPDKFIIELGHYMGLSSLCLSHAGSFVKTVDITFEYSHILKWPSNLHKQVNGRGEKVIPFHLLKPYDIIFVDLWHLGDLEKEIFEYLDKEGWKGILIYDDIHLNLQMKTFWDWIPRSERYIKIDATHIGHSTGTGIIEFI